MLGDGAASAFEHVCRLRGRQELLVPPTGEWRRRIEAWCRFRLRVVPAKANRWSTSILEEPDPLLP